MEFARIGIAWLIQFWEKNGEQVFSDFIENVLKKIQKGKR